MDVHVPVAITDALRVRGIDVISCQADGRLQASDEELLERATSLGRVIFTQDEDLLEIAARWTGENHEFSGVIYCHQLGAGIGRVIADLELVAKVLSSSEMNGQVVYLPLK